MQKFTNPFLHFKIKNFLGKDLQKATKYYNLLEFNPKLSDLYEFNQSNKLGEDPKLTFFSKKIKKLLTKLWIETGGDSSKNTWLSIFASNYEKNNYLLCHDDLVENRKFAFSFYLDNFESGSLILYDEKAENEVVRFGVERDTLVVFEVSKVSYHEVDLCRQSGRKAITGWFNVENFNAEDGDEKILQIKEEAAKSDKKKEKTKKSDGKKEIEKSGKKVKKSDEVKELRNIKTLLFDIKIKNDCIKIDKPEFDFSIETKKLIGPFYARRFTNLVLKNPVLMCLKGYKIVKYQFFELKDGNYILLNDQWNDLICDLDVFLVEGDKNDTDFITYVDEEGIPTCNVPLENGFYILKVKKWKKFIGRTFGNSKIAYFGLNLVND